MYLTFYDTSNYKNSKNNPCAASIFNETHIFRIGYIFLIYNEKRKEEKQIWIWTIILATQNSMNKKNAPKLIIRNTNRFEYYLIQQLFNDVSVFSLSHRKHFLWAYIHLVQICFVPFSRFHFFRPLHDFLRANAFAPVAPSPRPLPRAC